MNVKVIRAKTIKVIRTKQILSLSFEKEDGAPVVLDTFKVKSIPEAIFKLEEAYKVDKAFFDSVISRRGENIFSDESLETGKSYSFVIGNVKIQCAIQGFDDIADSLYSLTEF